MERAMQGGSHITGCEVAWWQSSHTSASMLQKAGACEAKPYPKATALAAGLDAFALLEQQLLQRQQALQTQKQDMGQQQQTGT